MATDGRTVGLGRTHQRPAAEIPALGNRGVASEHFESVRPHGRQSPRWRDRQGLRRSVTTDAEHHQLATGPIRGAHLEVGAYNHHLTRPQYRPLNVNRPVLVSQSTRFPVPVESIWSPNSPKHSSGVHLASKSHHYNSFVFSGDGP